jgi:hypothetical protein
MFGTNHLRDHSRMASSESLRFDLSLPFFRSELLEENYEDT